MTTDSFQPRHFEADSDDDEESTFAEDLALAEELQAWFLPMFIAATDQLASEEYRMVQDMLLIANIVLGLG